ncbi:MAG: polysaccharide biosynthesis protein [Leptospiraceae bacterium]|nr:polysaccharide biosynthesis protein [Leptospiraceae bacterium]MCB1320416.1 polysaccharide biosynthesis protein [Leptospiraceae bacterium]
MHSVEFPLKFDSNSSDNISGARVKGDSPINGHAKNTTEASAGNGRHVFRQLLGRDPVIPDLTSEESRSLAGKTVLVTGAGGSIGSEVCRRLIQYRPREIVLVDMSECALYEIDYELSHRPAPLPRIIPMIGDVSNERTCERMFRKYDVHAVFHCAAYKHVPMMEINPGEAVLNNVIGTRVFANAARDAGVERFVMVSTDKAVRPVSIMGASKRIAELYIQSLASVADTRFITVRFGNVLGSSGSVVPLFEKQIRNGGPVTITHPEMERYFMSIEEAANLVIQAGVMGREGEIFILDMGRPIRIIELAEHMIRQAGAQPYTDIPIQFIGLRPGEKLLEELLQPDERIHPTGHARIQCARSRPVHLQSLINDIDRLEEVALSDDRRHIVDMLQAILPEYRPENILAHHHSGALLQKDQFTASVHMTPQVNADPSTPAV